MTTERERQERQWRRNSPSRPRASYPRRRSSRNSFQDRLIIIVGVLSVLLALKHAPKWVDFSKIPEIRPVPFSSPSPQTNTSHQTKPKSIPIGNQSLQQYDYSKIDQLSASINYNGTSVEELANQLQAYATTDLEKARLIYAWITHHISYNYSGFVSGNYGDVTPSGILKSRQGVCSGYANLFQALAKEMGLEAHVIEGYAKGYGYAVGNSTDVNHAWNAVKINNAWYLVDSTWGAGYIHNNQFVKKFNPFYFATNPTQFIYDHLPSDEDWQLLSQRYSKEQFEQLPNISPDFFEYGLSLVNYQNHTIQAREKAEIRLNVPDNVVITATLYSQNYPLDNYTLVQTGQNQTGVYITFPSAGTYELNIYAKPKGQEGLYNQVMNYRLIASQRGQEFPTIYQGFSDNQAYLGTPLQKTLPANQSVHFNLFVPNAQEVQVISERGSKWTPLSRSGNSFEGTVPIEQGQIIVVAKFSNQSSYQYLVEYEGK